MSKQRLETFMSGWRSHDFQCPPIIAEPETAAVRQLGKQFFILDPADIVQQQRAAGWQSLDGFKQADVLGAHGIISCSRGRTRRARQRNYYSTSATEPQPNV